ncbi:hypothetical protein V8C40DRAFT_235636 [Trichoderma camerunense]
MVRKSEHSSSAHWHVVPQADLKGSWTGQMHQPPRRNMARFVDGPQSQNPETRIGSQSRDADAAGSQMLEQEPPPPASGGYPETPFHHGRQRQKRSGDADAARPQVPCSGSSACKSRLREALSLINLRADRTKRGNEGSLASLDLHKALGFLVHFVPSRPRSHSF